MGKTRKGEVSVSVFRDRLVLRWSWGGRRFTLYLGLPDSAVNRKVAEGRARIIEGDLATGNFDPTLAKYKTEVRRCVAPAELVQEFIKVKAPFLESTTLDKYRSLVKHLKDALPRADAADLKQRDAERFRDYLLTVQKPITVKDRLSILKACWNWARETGRVESNPWELVKIRAEKKSPQPFTADEVAKIVAAFEASPYYAYYAPYVRFLLSSGCRTGEAIGLRWGNVAPDCSRVEIVEAIRRSGAVKETKNHRVRTLVLSPGLQALLLERRPANPDPKALVFPAPEGGKICDHNFQRRAWAKCLQAAGVPYRKPYNTRHTALSHSLARGVSAAQVAEMAGDRLETVIRNYVGNVEGHPSTIDFD